MDRLYTPLEVDDEVARQRVQDRALDRCDFVAFALAALKLIVTVQHIALNEGLEGLREVLLVLDRDADHVKGLGPLAAVDALFADGLVQ